MLYLLLILIVGSLVYFGWRSARSQTTRSRSRVIGPDDDPEFLAYLQARLAQAHAAARGI